MTILAWAMNDYVRDWLDLLIRWTHVIAAIGWIGSSFYFVLLDQSLREPKDQADRDAGVGGELWEVHGGGFYHVKKYKVAPPELPDHLAWFKWEAYATWITGFSLLVILYWLDAKSYMIDPNVADIGAWTAVGISAGLLVAAWAYYDTLCRFVKNERIVGVAIAAGIALTAWGTGELYSPRAAWLQTGAMIGTVMAATVFFNIIPAHWELIRAKEAGRDPDPAPGIEAKRRSVHNNYFTLPVLVTMLAGHFTFLTGHDNSWLLLLFLMALGAWIRHFYNLRHGGKSHWWMLGVAGVAVAALFIALWPNAEQSSPKEQPAPGTFGGSTDFGAEGEDARSIFVDACGVCHTLADAETTGQGGPNLDQLKPTVSQVVRQVRQGGGGMPAFGNDLSAEEIDALATYVASHAGK